MSNSSASAATSGDGTAAIAPPLIVLVAITSLGPLALNMLVPAMPAMQRAFGVDYGVVQLTLTLYLFTTAVAPLIAGPMSDRFGRRPILLVGCAIYIFGSILCGIAPDIWTLIAGRIGQAIGGSIALSITRAIVVDVYRGDKAASVMGYVIAIMVVVPMIGTPVGGVMVEHVHWRAALALLFFYGLITGALVLFALNETNKNPRPLPSALSLLGDYKTLLVDNSAFRVYALISACVLSIFFSFVAGSPYVVERLFGMSPTEYGLFFVVAAVTHVFGNLASGRFSEKLGGDTMIWIGLILSLIGTFSMVALDAAGVLGPVGLFGAMALVSFANGLSNPNASASAVASAREMAGTASGLSSTVQLGVASVATVIVGLTQGGAATAMPTVAVMAALSLIALVVHAVGRPARQDLRARQAAEEAAG